MLKICKNCGKEYESNTCDICPKFPEDCSGDHIKGAEMCMNCCKDMEDE